jgi:GDSL-like lipase/acylhydrolase family protein/fibronectin type III domain protein
MRLSRGVALVLAAAGVLSLGCGGDVTSPSKIESPSNVTSQELPSGNVEVSWHDNSDNETAFELGRSSTGASGAYSVLATLDSNVSTFQDTTVDGASEYCYRVRAIGTSGTTPSAFSSPSCVQPTPPVAPSLLTTSASFGQVDLSWTDNSDNEASFEIWKSVDGQNGTFTLEASVVADVASYSNTGLQDGVEYCYRVRAVGAKGLASSFSNTGCATTPVPTVPPPAAPTNLVATAASPTSVSLTWTDHASDEQGFEIWRSATGVGGAYALLESVGANSSSADDIGLTGSTEYCYQVRAVGGAGVPPSDFTTASCATTPPAAPSNLVSTATSPTTVSLVWTDNATDEQGFQLWRSTTGGNGTYTLVTSLGADATTADDTGLTPGTQYCYKVLATGAGPSSDFSNSSCATTPLAPPATPTDLVLTVQSGSRIDLAWQDHASDEAGYEVWRSTTGASGSYTKRTNRPADSEAYSDTGLSSGTEYCYKVLAAGAGGAPDSPFTDPSCATTLAPPATPTNLVAATQTATRINLAWQDNATDEGGYELWRSTTGASGTYTKRSTLAANTESTSDTGLSPSTQYCYKVLAAGAGSAPDSPFTSPSCATTNAAVVVRITLFGDSNTDRCEEDPSLPGSYVSIAPRLGPNAAHLSCMVAGKVQAAWQSQRSETIRVVNHGIGGTTTGGLGGTGDPTRSANGAPNARLAVNGITRFEAEVLGTGAPSWNGGEPSNGKFSGPITRVNAYTPNANDFAYVSMGTNDDAGPTRTLTAGQTETNLRWMVQQWTGAGHPASHFILTTLPPRDDANSPTSIPDRNTRIRDIANDLGVHLVELSDHVSDDNGATWRSTSLNIGDGIHYTPAVRQWIADQVVSWMSSETPP